MATTKTKNGQKYDKKLEYISGQFKKAEHKKFEHYVVTRIWHLLNDLSIKFVTQQCIVRPNEGRALSDMYFPQLNISVEINEAPHYIPEKKVLDNIREADILSVINCSQDVINVTKNIEEVNEAINKVVEKIIKAKNDNKEFKPWNIEAEQNPLTYIEKGTINLKDDCAFKTAVEAVYCFGKKYKEKGIWKGGVNHPFESDVLIWFPKLKSKWFPNLFKNNKCNNSISDDEKVITEICAVPNSEEVKKHIDKVLRKGRLKRIVFAQAKSPLGDLMYRFKGVFELNLEKTSPKNGLIWDKKCDEVVTYKID